MKTPKPVWANRIVGYGEEAPDQILPHEFNWRVHPKNQQNIMTGILDEVGFVQPVVVNRITGKLLDGHMRVSIALSQNQPTVPVVYVELSPEDENTVLATLNPIAALAVPDESILNDVLGDIDSTNPELAAFLDGLYAEVNQGVLKSASGEDSEIETHSADGPKTKPTIRMLVQVPEVEKMEQAILATGAATRGAALMEICEFYISQRHVMGVGKRG